MNKRQISILFGLGLATLSYLICEHAGFSSSFCWTLAISSLCIVWWILEPVPIAATALIPIAILPMSGVLSPTQVAEAYGSPIILLLTGGAMLSTAMSHSGAHRRIALIMVKSFGQSSQRHVVYGFMLASALLSMWISNTATVLMLLPVATAIIERAHRDQNPEHSPNHNPNRNPNRKLEAENNDASSALAQALLLSIAFGASIGGMGTPIGTPPNLIFIEVYKEYTGRELGFFAWMTIGLPVVLILLPIAGFWLARKVRPIASPALPELGRWQSHEKRVLVVFGCTALLWITRQEPLGGWSGALNLTQANDASVALLAVLAMFLIPRGDNSNEALLTWRAASRIPWGVILLFASGICIAKAFKVSGLSDSLGAQLGGLASAPALWMILGIALSVSLLTETTSNTASTALLMPILAAAALASGNDPKLLMVPAAMSASCAFMLPIATGPNAIVFGSGHLKVKQMLREGLPLNIFAALIITAVCWLLLYWRA